MTARVRFWLLVTDALGVVFGVPSRPWSWALQRAADSVEYEPTEPVSEEDAPW